MKDARKLSVGESHSKSLTAYMSSIKAVGSEVYLSSSAGTDFGLSSTNHPDLPQDKDQVVLELAAREMQKNLEKPLEVGAGLEYMGKSCYLNAAL